MSDPAFSLLDPKVQESVWKMGWKELNSIQVQSIHCICESKKHLIVCAPTAGGKTEAAFLPIISKIATLPQSSVQALYIGPLKALINDQFERLEELCGKLEMPVHRWHGDVPANQKKALRDTPGGILLITPESLESNFINFGAHVPRVYQNLSYVVIDEMHSFLNDVRGVHLRSLLSRLKTAAGCNPRFVGLSATLADPLSARTFVAPDDVNSVQIVEDPSAKREIKFGIKAFLKSAKESRDATPKLTPKQALDLANGLPSALNNESMNIHGMIEKQYDQPVNAITDDFDEIADDIIKHFRLSTNLIFGNSKQTIEILADRLQDRVRQEHWPTNPFVVHHGSLSMDLREDAEAMLKSGVPTTALCSSALEMGIDIGHVRAVGQIDVPWSVSSMVQRLGRSGRRTGEAATMRMYVRENSPNGRTTLTDLLYPDLLRSVAMTRLMLRKWLEPFDQSRMHISTLIHQVLSCLKQTGGLPAAEIYQALCLQGPFRNITQAQFAELLRGLTIHDLVEQVPQGQIVLGLTGERLTSSFEFYSAFNSKDEFVVRAGAEEIGKLPADIIPPVGEHLLLAGKRWRIEQIVFDQKLVLVTFSPGGKALPFHGEIGEIHTEVLQEMKTVLFGDGEPAYLDQNGKILLLAARAAAEAAGLSQRNAIVGRQSVQWFPWVGTRTLLTLALLAKSANIVCEFDRLSLSYRLSSYETFLNHLRHVATSQLNPATLASLMPVKCVEKFDKYMPESLLQITNGRNRLNVNEAQHVALNFLRDTNLVALVK